MAHAEDGRQFVARPEALALIAIILVAATLRLAMPGDAPPPIQQDEASRGYDAWHLLTHATDRWGVAWPAFLRGFGPGDYTGSISAYLMMPFVALLGATTTAFRMPSAILAILTVPVVWMFVRRHFGSVAAIGAAASLAICPWHILLTRTAHESALMPFFFVSGLLCMSLARLPPFFDGRDEIDADADRRGELNRGVAAAFAGGMFGLAAWTYPAARLLVPLMLIVMVAIAPRSWRAALVRRRSRRYVGVWIAGLVIGAAPIWWTLIRAPRHIAARAESTLVFGRPLPLGEQLARVAANYAAEWSPATMLTSFTDIARGETSDFGRLLWIQAPLLLVGFVLVISRAKQSATCRFLLCWLILAPIPAAICADGWNPHPMRAFLMTPLLSMLIGVGMAVIVRRVAPRAPAARNTAIAVGAVAVGLNLAWFSHRLFVAYPRRSADAFQENLMHAMARAAALESQYAFIHVTPYAQQPYVYTLLATPDSPREFADHPPVIVPWYTRFEHVLRWGPYLYQPGVNPTTPMGAEVRAAYRKEIEALPPDARGLSITVPQSPFATPGRVVAAIPRRGGGIGLELREITAADLLARQRPQ